MANHAATLQDAPADAAMVYWLPLPSALAHFDVSRAELVHAVKAGELRSRRIVCGDDLAVALSSTELLQRYPRRPEPASPEPPTGAAALIPKALFQEQAAELARVQAHLDAADQVERSLQRYADRLEAELRTAHRMNLALAQALGTSQGRERVRNIQVTEETKKVAAVG